MTVVSDVYTPSEWDGQADFYDGIEDPRQRRALALIAAFGTMGGGDKVCFVDELIVIAAPPVAWGDGAIELVVRPLDEFIAEFSRSIVPDADPEALRWVEKIVHWSELGC